MEVMQIKPFRHYLLKTFYFHLFFIASLSLNLYFKKNKFPTENIITVDIAPVSSVTNLKTINVEHDKSIKNDNAKLVKKSANKQKTNTKKTPQLKKNKKIEKKIPQKKTIKKVKKKTTPNQNKKSDNNHKHQQSKIKKNLKNIEKSSQGNQENSKKQSRENTTHNKSESLGKENTDDKISITEARLIQSKIEENWDQAFLLGINGIENVEITLLISFSYDGSLSGDPLIKETSCPGIDNNICDAIARSVLSAVIKSSPIHGLPIDRYESWKQVLINFRPEI